jgi:hypothetical protein
VTSWFFFYGDVDDDVVEGNKVVVSVEIGIGEVEAETMVFEVLA